MLHKETVAPSTLELLVRLQKEQLLASFNLVGGTSLSLRLGHRKSVDLDLFSPDEFDVEDLRDMLVQKYDFRLAYLHGRTIKGFIGDVMMDCIRYNYPHLHKPEEIDGIRMESLQDVAAMKLSAVSQNGSRIKDFIDIATLSSRFSLNEMLNFYTSKFSGANALIPIKSMTYFDDIDFSESVVMTTGVFDWNAIANRLFEMVESPDRVFA